MPQIAKVAVAAATYAIDKPYDYLIPQGTDIAVGMRVLAPFGRGNRVSEGVVLALGQGVPDKPIKPIRSVVDREPVITDREIRLALWMRERYFCTFYDAIRTILPAAVWYSYREMWSLTGEPLPEDLSEREAAACRLLQDGPMERDDLCAALGETGSRVLAGLKKRGILQMEPQGSRKVQDRVVQIACLALEPEEALERMERKKKSAARQYDAVAFLAKYGDAVVQELCYYTGVSRQGIRSLERAGLVSLRSQEEYRISRRDYDAAAEEITLNDEQQRAYDEILRQLEAVQKGRLEDWEMGGARSTLLNAYASMGDSQGKLENFYLGQAATGQTESPEDLAAQLRDVTDERVFRAMETVGLDTVYFLKGKEAAE